MSRVFDISLAIFIAFALITIVSFFFCGYFSDRAKGNKNKNEKVSNILAAVSFFSLCSIFILIIVFLIYTAIQLFTGVNHAG